MICCKIYEDTGQGPGVLVALAGLFLWLDSIVRSVPDALSYRHYYTKETTEPALILLGARFAVNHCLYYTAASG